MFRFWVCSAVSADIFFGRFLTPEDLCVNSGSFGYRFAPWFRKRETTDLEKTKRSAYPAGRADYLSAILRFAERTLRTEGKVFASVDGVDHVAFVALDPKDLDEIVAVVRYDREQSEDEEAEYAALVEDRWQDYGTGIALTRELINEAKDNGVRCFYALVMGENKRMLELLRYLDLPEQERQDREHGVKRIEIEIISELYRAGRGATVRKNYQSHRRGGRV